MRGSFHVANPRLPVLRNPHSTSTSSSIYLSFFIQSYSIMKSISWNGLLLLSPRSSSLRAYHGLWIVMMHTRNLFFLLGRLLASLQPTGSENLIFECSSLSTFIIKYILLNAFTRAIKRVCLVLYDNSFTL